MTTDKSPDKIECMFNKIACDYDRNNNIISFGLHNFIKYLAIKESGIKNGDIVLDLCCGTGDIAGLISTHYKNSDITGYDFSDDMLMSARKKYPGIKFEKADITSLPVDNSVADAVTVAFGLRNVYDRIKAVAEMYRVLKSQGRVMHLDFGRHNIFSCIFDIIVRILIKIFSKDVSAYEYLLNSKSEFPEPTQLVEEFKKCGFKLLKRKDFVFGIISMQVFIK